ncbi:MAG: SIS domain-containing protein [Magnetovibrio sp.]|nr:SIS domain-containing protein [Magnetovibrio sp.]
MTLESLQATAKAIFEDSARLKQEIADDSQNLLNLARMAEISALCIQKGGKLMLCGNGGSAGDAQHITAELLIRLRSDRDRAALPALCLTMDMSTLTACANDYGFERVFERPLRALAKPGDVLIGFTTSGNSSNVICAMKAAQDLGVTVLGFLGGTGGEALALCETSFRAPNTMDPGRIQETHITAGHALVEMIEDSL